MTILLIYLKKTLNDNHFKTDKEIKKYFKMIINTCTYYIYRQRKNFIFMDKSVTNKLL